MDIKELLERRASLIRQPDCGDYTDFADREELAHIEGEIAVIEQKAITEFYKDIMAEMIEFPTVDRALDNENKGLKEQVLNQAEKIERLKKLLHGKQNKEEE